MTLRTFSSTLVTIVALTSLILTILTWIAYRRTGQQKVRYVAGAFGVHTIKGTIVAYGLSTGTLPHEVLEVIEAVFDAAMVTLLFIPFWTRN